MLTLAPSTTVCVDPFTDQLVSADAVSSVNVSASQTLFFNTGGAVRAQFTSGGALGIGKTPTSGLVDVAGVVNATGFSMNGVPTTTGIQTVDFNQAMSTTVVQKEVPAAVTAMGDGFGGAVRVSSEGDWAIVGAGGKGSVYMYGVSSRMLTLNRAWDGAVGSGSGLGSSVAIGYDSSIIVVGAPGSRSVMYALREGAGWEANLTTLGASVGAGTYGARVAVSGLANGGYYVVVGDPTEGSGLGRVYVYFINASTRVATLVATHNGTIAGSGLGSSVAINNDGSLVAEGSPGDQNGIGVGTGCAYVVARTGTGATASYAFGGAVKVSPSGSGVAAGVRCGTSVSLDGTGSTLALGCPLASSGTMGSQVGAVFVFTKAAAGLSYTQAAGFVGAPSTMSQDQFGTHVSLDASGAYMTVGAQRVGMNAGAVYMYALASGMWMLMNTVTAPDGVVNARFGAAVAMASGASVVLVGASGAVGTGAVYSLVTGATAFQSRAASNVALVDAPLSGGSVQVGGQNASTIEIGAGTAQSGKTIRIGASGDTVYLNGNTVIARAVSTAVGSNMTMTLNDGGAAGTAVNAGLLISEGGSNAAGYWRTTSNRQGWELKAPAMTGSLTFIPNTSNVVLNAESLGAWTAGTSNSVYKSSGNVGIGKALPAFALDVAGDINFTGILRSNSVPYISSQWTTAGNYIFLTGSNVAIGKNTAAFPLDVVGDINFTGILRNNGSPYVSSQWTGVGNRLFVTTYNIGIGKSNPNYALDVTGDINFTGLLRSNGEPFELKWEKIVGAPVAMSNTTTLTTSAAPEYFELLQNASNVVFSGGFTYNSSVFTTVGGSALIRYAGSGFTTAASGPGKISATVSLVNASSVVVSSKTVSVFSNGGQVAFPALEWVYGGMPAGTYTMRVVFSSNMGSDANSVHGLAVTVIKETVQTTLSAFALYSNLLDTSNTVTINTAPDYFELLQNDTSAIVFSGTSGSTYNSGVFTPTVSGVGLVRYSGSGMALPNTAGVLAATVSVREDATNALVGTAKTVSVYSDGSPVNFPALDYRVDLVAGTAYRVQIVFGAGTVSNAYTPHNLSVTVHSATASGVYPNYVSQFLNFSLWSNNVGIGKSNPAFALDVAGDVNFTGLLRSNGVPYVGSQWTSASNASGSNVYLLGSNVGVRTSNPGFALDVGGDINFTGILRSNGVAYVGSQWTTSGSNLFLLGSNVGIGLSNPQNRLDVAGDINFSGILKSNNVPYVGSQWTTAGSNIFLLGSNVGIRTSNLGSNAALVVAGNVRVDNGGVILNGSNEAVWLPGNQASWTTIMTPALTWGSGGAFTASGSQVRQRYIGSDLTLSLYYTGTVNTVASTGDVTLTLPVNLNTALYTSNNIIGELWVTVGNTTYKGYVRTSAGVGTAVTLRFMSGTMDSSLATVPLANSVVTIQGDFTYSAASNNQALVVPSAYLPASFVQDVQGKVVLNGNGATARGRFDIVESNNNIPALVIDGRGTGDILQVYRNQSNLVAEIDYRGYLGLGRSNPDTPLHLAGNMKIEGGFILNGSNEALWLPGSQAVWTTTSVPALTWGSSGGAFTVNTGSSQASVRYVGNDYVLSFNITGTVGTVATAGDVLMMLPVPVKTGQYTVDTIVGDLWVTVGTTTFKAYARTRTADVNTVVLRCLTGTNDASMATALPVGSATIQGSITYAANQNNGAIAVPSIYRPADFVQDSNGQVVVGGSGAVPRGRFDIVDTGSNAALVVDERGTGNILELRSNQTRVVTVTNNGNLGIGTSNTPYRLAVHDGQMQLAQSNGSWGPIFALSDKSIVSGNGGNAWIQAVTGGIGYHDLHLSGLDVVFNTGSVELMRIKASGNVGIGITNPGKRIEVHGDVVSRYAATTGSVAGSLMAESSGVGLWANASYDPANPGTNWGRNMFLATNGRTGVGTSTPNARFHVVKDYGGIVGGNGSEMVAKLVGTDAGVGDTGLYITQKGIGGMADTQNFVIQTMSYGNPLMTQLVSGNVGIGTTAPDEKLHVAGIVKVSSGIYTHSWNHHYYSGNGLTQVNITGATPGAYHATVMPTSANTWGDIRGSFIIYAMSTTNYHVHNIYSQYVSCAVAIYNTTDIYVNFTFGSPSAQYVNVRLLRLS